MAASLFPTTRISNGLPLSHLLCHEQHHSQVTHFHAAEQAAELGKHTGILTLVAPFNIVASPAFREIWQLGRLLSIVEELVHRNFKGTGKLLQRLDSRNCVPVFDTRDIAPKQSCSFLDLP